jgi:hypothetical protein
MIALLFVLLQAQDNLDYQYWKSCAAGSWVKLRVESAPGGKPVVKEVLLRLVSVTPQEAVVERQTRTTAEGRSVPESPYLERIPAKKPRADVVLREGEEEIEVAGKKLSCKVLEMEQADGAGKNRIKLWASSEVPGGAVKMELRKPGADAPELTVRAEGWLKK